MYDFSKVFFFECEIVQEIIVENIGGGNGKIVLICCLGFNMLHRGKHIFACEKGNGPHYTMHNIIYLKHFT